MTIPALSPETTLLRDALLAAPVGDTVTYAALSEALGRRVDGAARSVLASARRIAARDHGALFEPVRGVGLRRLAAADAGKLGKAARQKIGRAARRGARDVSALIARDNAVPDDQRAKAWAEAAALGLIGHLARRDPAPMAAPDGPMPPAKAAAAFLKHIDAKETP